MSKIVRAIDVGFGNTKFVVGHTEQEIKCASFPSLAYTSAKDPATRPAAERRRTVAIPIDGTFYEVGPEVHLAADTFRATQLHDQYVETPEYMALARGAMAYMKLSAIDLLVVGLPVSSFQARKAYLEKAMVGVHDLGGGKTVEVRKAVAVAQPQGALVYYTAAYHKQKSIEHEQSLIIEHPDVRRMLLTIELAKRTGKPLMIYQKPYDLAPILPTARAVARRAVSSMMEWITEDYSIQNVILVGGGAFMFKDAVKAAFPNHKIYVVKEPMFANVKGFQIAGDNLLTAQVTAGEDRDGQR